MTRFDNDVILVTGGTAGIGRAIVERLCLEGAQVIVADLDPCGQAGPRPAAEIPTDVGDPSAIADLFAEIGTRFGRLSGLVNCAGITRHGDLLGFPLDTADLLWRVNLRGPFLCCQEAARLMEGRGGAILNIASVHAYATAPGFEMYAATKSGVVAMTAALALSLGPERIRVNALSPGLVRTEAVGDWLAATPGAEARHAANSANGRIITPAEIAAIAAFLLSPDAEAITGADIRADQGAAIRLFKHGDPT